MKRWLSLGCDPDHRDDNRIENAAITQQISYRSGFDEML